MEVLGIIAMVVGIGAAVVGGIWFLVTAFQESVLWGLGCLIIPLVSLVFLIMHWDKAGKPFLIYLAGVVVAVGGSAAMDTSG